jgi:hypothetical protein
MFDQIASQDLTEGDLPPPDARWWRICEFALTFDGYDYWGSFDKCSEIGNHWAASYAEQQALPESLTELRTCLFFEQRRWHHVGDDPDDDSIRYIWALIESIRSKVMAGDLE